MPSFPEPIKIIFFGTPEFAVPFLDYIYKHASVGPKKIQVVSVITQPDKPVGRKQELTPSALKRYAQKEGIPVFDPKNLKNPETIRYFKTHPAHVYVLVQYGKLIPLSILEIPPYGIVNFHPSLLPNYRGPDPIRSPILEGDEKTGATIMLLGEGMDTGPILAQESFALDRKETLASLTEKFCKMGPSFLFHTLEAYLLKKIIPTLQDETKATITHLLSREDGRINWNQSAQEIERKIRAYTPWPGCWTIWKDHQKNYRVKILTLEIHDLKESFRGPIGSLHSKDKRLFVVTGKGIAEITLLQREGKSPVSAEIFLKGYSITGTCFQ